MNQTSPIFFEPNRIRTIYQGGRLINEIMGKTDKIDTNMSEEWLASVDIVQDCQGQPGTGLSVIKDQVLTSAPCTFKKLIMHCPQNILGPEHVQEFGPEIGFRCKLMDIAENPPEFVDTGDQAHSQASAFFILATREIGDKAPAIFLREIDGEKQVFIGVPDSNITRKCRKIASLTPGDTIFVPAGLDCKLCAGIFILHIQVSTTQSVSEFSHRPVTENMSDEQLATLLKPNDLIIKRSDEGASVEIIGPERTRDFTLKRLEIVGRYQVKPSSPFCLVFCASGAGRLRWASGGCEITTGDYFFMPYTVPWVEVLSYNKTCLIIVEPADTNDYF